LEYRKRLLKLKLPARYGLYTKYRRALKVSRIEILPPEIRANLKCVVDVGANIGEWSEGMVDLGQAKRIIAFEPIPDVFKLLQENTKTYPQIECRNLAVGSHTGEVVINVEENSNSLSSILPMRDEIRPIFGIVGDVPRQVTVPLTTLDISLADVPEITLLKLDVQGYEPEVLAGAHATLQRTKALMIEIVYAPYYHGDVLFETIHNLITSISPLKLYGISEPGYHPVTGQPLWADAIYVRA
jgi:FkbM family methyltransferase